MDLSERLNSIPCSQLTRDEWLNVGMALNEEGYSVSVWDEWSQNDSRYKSGECERLWDGFGNYEGKPITGAFVTDLAKEYGWKPHKEGKYRALSDDDYIEYVPQVKTVYPLHAEFNPNRETREYLRAVFKEDDHVGYVVRSHLHGEKFVPADRGLFSKTRKQLETELAKFDDIGYVFGDYDHRAGAWIRFNPLDGKGCNDKNITEYRYTLIESDTLSVDEQFKKIKELKLPCAAVVHSGGKSIHAIVHIDAGNDKKLYKQRIQELYEICKEANLEIDEQNKNASRLSRFPGFYRNGHKQFLIATNIGFPSYQEWYEWRTNAGLPPIKKLRDNLKDMDDLADQLIEGILRMKHKLCIQGASKAGKSFMLIELCLAFALGVKRIEDQSDTDGFKWMNWKRCRSGRVLYVNLELDSNSCNHRFADLCNAIGLKLDDERLDNIDIWNLRGHSAPLDQLTPELIRFATKQKEITGKGYSLVIIDPIYKVLTGDENSASDMANFVNEFDKIAEALDCSICYVHHHSKGAQKSYISGMNMASGSGVFGRDPDSIINLVQLDLNDDIREQYFKEYGIEYDDERFDNLTAWRIDTTLREFPSGKPIDIFFDYPRHIYDNAKLLENAVDEAYAKEQERKNKTNSNTKLNKIMELFDTYGNKFREIKGNPHKGKYAKFVTKNEMFEIPGINKNNIYEYADELGLHRIENIDGKTSVGLTIGEPIFYTKEELKNL